MVIQAVDQGAGFGGGGIAREQHAEAIAQAAGGVGATFLHHALAERAGGFDEGDVVHEVEGLHGSVGAGFADDAGLATGGVEGHHHGRRDGAFPERVEAAAVEVVAVALSVVHVLHGGLFPESGGLIGHDGRATDLFGEQAGGEEGLVADGFGGQAEAGASCEEAVFGVAGDQIGRGGGGLAIGCGGDHQANHGFDVPVGADEFGGEPVEEFGMAGWFALDTEVLGGFDEAGAEDGLPEAVDGDTGGEGIAGVDKPLREAEAVFGGVGGELGQRRGHGALNLLAGFIVSAAFEQKCGAGLEEILHHHDGGEGLAHAVEIEFQIDEGFRCGLEVGGRAGFEECGAEREGLGRSALGGRSAGDLAD